MSHHDRSEGVHQRRFHFCETLASSYGMLDLFLECGNCNRFFARCCHHGRGSALQQREGHVCHHWPVIFTDGACPGNGTPFARGGIGYALGANQSDQLSMPFNIEELGAPTSQKMELVAAFVALSNFKQRWIEGPDRAIERYAPFTGDVELVIATDSEYVAIGITEWYPVWRNNGWKNQNGDIPANLDLFKLLDHAVSQVEALGVAVGFIHIPREVNAVADGLATDGANAVLFQ